MTIMQIPNLAEGGQTHSPWHPIVRKVSEPTRSKTGLEAYLWTLTLLWRFEGAAITSVGYPPPFKAARETILRAASSKEMPPYLAQVSPRVAGVARILAAVAGTPFDLGLNDLAARVDRVKLIAKFECVEVVTLLRVETLPEQAPQIVRLRDAGVVVSVAVQQGLFDPSTRLNSPAQVELAVLPPLVDEEDDLQEGEEDDLQEGEEDDLEEGEDDATQA